MIAARTDISSRTERRLLALILAGYTLLAVTYSIVTPIFEASDELWHYPMVQHIATTGQLPVQDAARITPWRQEGSQPPLYYIWAALLTAGIDTSDLSSVRRQNPHADIGVVLPDGNVNMVTHRNDLEAFPWRGTTLAVQVARFFSIALGLGTVYVTYRLAREIFPRDALVRLGASALVAFLPMFLFISGSVNNDNLSNLLGNLLLLLIVRLLTAPSPPRWQGYVFIGMVTGAGLLAKLNLGFLIPLVMVALLAVSLREKDWRPLVIGGAISGGLTIAIAGWWYIRNQQLYGDVTGLNVFLQIVGRRAVPANLAQLWSERHSFTQAYWGFFGGVNVPLPDPIYLVFNVLGGVGLLAATAFALYRITRRANSRLTIAGWLPAALTVVWPVISFLSYLRWTAETPASQGRLIFAAISPISMWMAVGLIWWLPHRFRPVMLGGAVLFFVLVAILAPFMVIAPAYQPQEVSDTPNLPLATFTEPGGSGGIRLLSARIPPESDQVQPEDFVFLDTVWHINQQPDRDWSLFVHLVTPDGVILGQRDVYPAQGLLATSDLQPGYRWRNDVAVRVPPAAYAPMPLDVMIGWYHLPTGERLSLEDGAEMLTVGQVELLPRTGGLDVPNPIRINFGDLIELVGYELTDLSPEAGDTVELTLYWLGLRAMTEDYKVFANIIDPPTLTKYAASDSMPANWSAPTSTWTVGEIVVDRHALSIDSNAVPGIYELQIGLYREVPDGLERLRILTSDGGQANDVAYLSRVRVLPAAEVIPS